MPTLSEYKMEEPDQNQVEAPENKEEIQGGLIEESLEDDLAVDIPDIPLPSLEEFEEKLIEDEFEGAYKFAVVGVGQGGSRLAETFWKTYWDLPLKQGKEKNVKSTYRPGKSFF